MDEIQFLQEILQINSSNPPGNEHKVTEVFIERCKKKGIPFKLTFLEENRSNFEVTLKGKGDKHLFLCGHMDTVSPGEIEWDHAPFSGEIVGERIYGRGASDMKSGLAAMYLALESLYLEKDVPPATITFLATAGEEVDSCGARAFLNNNENRVIDALVIGEPTNEKIVVGHKGALWLEISTFGKTAHGAMPHQGINAVDHMVEVIKVLDRLKIDWKLEREPLGSSSLAVTMINGGIQTNVIPDKCTIRIDIRTVPPQSHDRLMVELNTELNKLVERNILYQFNITKVLDRPPVLTPVTSDIIQCAFAIKDEQDTNCFGVSYYTDAAVLNPRSVIPTLIYGPGDEKLAHQPNEWVSISSYRRSIEFYKSLILSYSNETADSAESLQGGVK
ncbi:M20 family metallopeptidase [Bacillus sp. S/N-304-OC-R1]|uniref:M20 family metallopeptidase n=1 Tax=Bacillus sp. S/N-304-OC-R1 TaxID=2758034 RepID=UPI001C8D4730|nr:M20 family metallopeptidase [Bacillus sp. S/N-304-OC-R1]MBY0120488.1 M20 family metallopeptidase [Bacillus sp. S/N-304-OC-R1]